MLASEANSGDTFVLIEVRHRPPVTQIRVGTTDDNSLVLKVPLAPRGRD